jgi:hypothetical protein
MEQKACHTFAGTTQLPSLSARYSTSCLNCTSHRFDSAWSADSGPPSRRPAPVSQTKPISSKRRDLLSLNRPFLCTWRCLSTHLPNELNYFNRDEFTVEPADGPRKRETKKWLARENHSQNGKLAIPLLELGNFDVCYDTPKVLRTATPIALIARGVLFRACRHDTLL